MTGAPTAKNGKSKQAMKEVFPRKTLNCVSGPSDDEKGRAYADLLNSPALAAYRVISMMQPKLLSEEIDLPTFLEVLKEDAAKLQEGDMTRAEAMLINQASALQALFVRLSERAMEQTGMSNLEGFMKLSLRAQAQCRATLETLSAIKNPPVVYAKQVNVTTGPQQVNNSYNASSRAEENKIEQNKLSGDKHELRTHARTPSITSQTYSQMEAMGQINWSNHGGR
jgi:hypothetical protein